MIQSLTDILDTHRVDYRRQGQHHHATRGRVSVDCPWCSPGSRRYRLGLGLHVPSANCWTCGKKDYIESLVRLIRQKRQQVKELVLGLPQIRQYAKSEVHGTLEVPSGLLGIRDIPAYWNYLKSRRFDPAEIETYWGVKGTCPGKDLQWRLWIPITDKFGRTVSWTTRSVGSEETAAQKYISASPEQEGMPHKHLLYAEQYAVNTIIIAEGPIDVWAIGPGAVATFGSTFTAQQIAKAAAYPIRVVCYDNEPEAQKQARSLCRDLSALPGITENVILESGDDPGSADEEEILELRKRFGL